MNTNNYNRYILFFLLGLLVGIILYASYSVFFISPGIITTVFSPDNGDGVISLIDSARETTDIEMYVFTSEEVADALKRAKDRGVEIRIILEKRVITEENEKFYNELNAYGIDVKWASKDYKLTHAKFIIVDGKRVLVGSHNFSDSALKSNREASIIIADAKTVSEFITVFERDWSLV